MTAAPSLFDVPASPALGSAVGWLSNALLGSVATGLCVIAVALIGLMLMTGRLPIRDGLRVVLGCFVLLGALVIASGLHGVVEEAMPSAPAEPLTIETTSASAGRPPANYDPYAGASLRRD